MPLILDLAIIAACVAALSVLGSFRAAAQSDDWADDVMADGCDDVDRIYIDSETQGG